MHSSPLTALCPAAAEVCTPVPYPYPNTQQHPQPHLRSKGRSARGLALSFTLPGDVRSSFIGRTVIAAALDAHGLSRTSGPPRTRRPNSSPSPPG
ncbi:hypothetical protein ACIO6T_33935 [Streptomyces sp. NPDC087532]|uniref:hypothetical protein n=1 Tax=unclassified Streptomyces TaxID=2593676 RepID=UPI00344008B0